MGTETIASSKIQHLCANVRFFDTGVQCFRAGLVKGKLLILQAETR